MIELKNITRLYRSVEVSTAALRSIDLTIAKGEFLAIMGPSGCGKSTLLNILGAIDRPTTGSYHYDGLELTRLNEANLAEFRARHLGFVFQSFNLVDDLTVQENVELGVLYRKDLKGQRSNLVEAALDRVGLAHRARHFPNQLSGGQQQRVAIARAIAGSPDLILADEPTGNLDSENGAQIMSILKGLNAAGSTIVMVTHSRAQADQASRQIDMLDGRLLLSVTRAV
ncbi:ABC transporter family protein [Asticcacaulis biprosthecium C19]|uniref:ABC transporter family protein n=1 Tax=Asticcacaulis biprosthecium C19 TaxID=715226 RepID=F4QLM9_9CAUL|nr:ABC transporter ATP-binding protein [Asticcacaulis biprosthecium]EGF93527.1 ABC transporter family protein [Asticcacaulis biprosthecium C19]